MRNRDHQRKDTNRPVGTTELLVRNETHGKGKAPPGPPGRMKVMDALTTAPAGFCPKCYYPIDPGICPECGTLVTDQSILTSLSQTRAAKTRRWAFRILIFVILPVAAIYGAWRVPWPGLMPSGLLLSMQGDAQHWATTELCNRYLAGQLQPAQLD